MSVQDSRKLLPGEFYPSWVVFSQRQKLSYSICLYTKSLLLPSFIDTILFVYIDTCLIKIYS